MYINSLHIISFGGLKNRVIEMKNGVNVIDGANESGKTSAAMFIKFIFYGLSSKALKADGASERMRFINRDTMQAAGYIIATADDGTEYRIERAIVMSESGSPRERIRIINQETGDIITGKDPGEYFFGVPESVFVGTAFVGQNKSVKPDIAGEGTSKGSVENLLTSADENVDIKRAVKKLDAVRRELCHKNGSGGEISSLREKRAALKAERDDSATRAAEILSASTSANDIRSKIADYEATAKRQEKIISALTLLDTGKKFDSLDSAAKTVADIAESVRMIDSSPVGRDFSAKLSKAEEDIRSYDDEKAEYDEIKDDLPEESDIPEKPDVDAAVGKARRCERMGRAFYTLAISALVCGIIAFVAAIVMYILGTDKFYIPFAAAIAAGVIGILLIVARGKRAKWLREYLDTWSAQSTNDLEDALNARCAAIDELIRKADEKAELEDSLDSAFERKEAAVETVVRLARSVNIKPSDNIYATLQTLNDMSTAAENERITLITKSDKLKGRLEVLSEQLEGVDRIAIKRELAAILATEEGKLAAKMTPDDIKGLEKQREFTQSALHSAIKRKEALDEKLSELGKLSHTPDELETMINSLDERITELSLRRDACTLAKEALTKAGEAMRSDVIPRLGKKASEYISGATGRYTSMTIDGSFACGIGDGEEYKTADIFSRGTADIVYIALRVALADEVFRADRPTVVFDESFAHVDSGRLGGMIKMLSERDGQYLIFTCRTEESSAAEATGGNVVRI